MLARDSGGYFSGLIKEILPDSRFKDGFNFNSEIDTSKLNFYLLDVSKDTALKNLCAFIGENTVVVDKSFLIHYLDSQPFVSKNSQAHFDKLNRSFQLWVLGHEIAHADLRHSIGHFINSAYPKTQDSAKLLQGLEFDADRRSLLYLKHTNLFEMQEMLTGVFNSDYDRRYHADKTNKAHLKIIQDPYLGYPYELDGS